MQEQLQTLETSIEASKTLSGQLTVAIIVCGIIGAAVTGGLALWHHRLGKRIDAMGHQRDQLKAKVEEEKAHKQQETIQKVADTAQDAAARTLPRQLSKAQRDALIDALIKVADRPDRLPILYPKVDAEARQLAVLGIQAVFSAAGWETKASTHDHNLMNSFFDFGLGRQSVTRPAYAEGVVNAFKEAGIPLYEFVNEDFESAALVVFEKSPQPQDIRERMQEKMLAEQDAVDKYLRPRFLAEEQIASFRQVLREIGPQTISFASHDGNTEAGNLLAQFQGAFAAEKWSPLMIAGQFSMLETGIVLHVHCRGCMPAWVDTMHNEISQMDLDCAVKSATDIPPSSVRFSVGKKERPDILVGPVDRGVDGGQTLANLTAQMHNALHKQLGRPRTLTDKQAEKLRAMLVDVGPQSICLAAIGGKEQVAFAKQLIGVFESANWVVRPGVRANAIDGISVMVHSEESKPSWADRLVKTLRDDLHFECRGRTSTSVPKNVVTMFISRNPLEMIPKPDLGFPPHAGSQKVIDSYVDENGEIHIRYVGPDGPQADSP